MNECNYCKIEKEGKALSFGQIQIIARCLNVNWRQILSLSEFNEELDFIVEPISKVLVEYVLKLQKNGEHTGFTEEELKFIVTKIKQFYN